MIVVGQAYPNIKSLELQEKIQYLNKNQVTKNLNTICIFNFLI